MNYKNSIVAGFLAASAVFFGVAQAQGMGGMGGPGGARGCDGARPGKVGMMRDGFDPAKRLGMLKEELKITAQQEPLWQAFADQTKGTMGKGMAAMRENKASDEKLPAPERMAKMQTLMKERLAAMETVNESFKRLYAALTPEQQASADAHFSRMGHSGHGRHSGRGGPNGPAAAEGRKG
jgi:Spy/CpxP family protein refolding chaperone